MQVETTALLTVIPKQPHSSQTLMKCSPQKSLSSQQQQYQSNFNESNQQQQQQALTVVQMAMPNIFLPTPTTINMATAFVGNGGEMSLVITPKHADVTE